MFWELLEGALIAAFFQVLFDRLACRDVLEFFLGREFDRTLFDQLYTALLTVNAVLDDAGEKQITNPAVKQLVNELQHAVFHAEDLLDEIASTAEILDRRKVLSGFFNYGPCFPDIQEIEFRFKKIVERIVSLTNQRDLLNLPGSVIRTPPPTQPTTSLLNQVFGRDKDKKKLINFLLSDNAQHNEIPVIAIVGMCGIGKTALAQLLYNDSDVERRFEFRSWVHVSEKIDVFNVTKTIYESCTSEVWNVRDLNVLQLRLKETLNGKIFLIVLDGILNDNFIDWDLFLRPLKSGAPGSRILVTTRSQNVASIMGAVVTHFLQHLSFEDCWSLFEKYAFLHNNLAEHPNLRRVGEGIVKRCNGHPLATKALAGFLRTKAGPEEWRGILNSTILNQPSILHPFLSSYYDLSPQLRQCFAFCSIFPKGYEFDKEKLILIWMAAGFLQRPKGEHTMEEVGGYYFSQLLSMSFFQQSSDKEGHFVMHDLLNLLAQFVSGEFCSKFEDGKLLGVSEKTRHFACLMDLLGGPEQFVPLQESKCLRTFLPLSSSDHGGCSALSKMVIDVLLSNLKHLRVLSFSHCAITQLPRFLHESLHLRYLDLSHTSIRKLPSWIHSLYNLQTLLLTSCRELCELPADITKLINLRHLHVHDTKLRKMPLQFGRLENLQVLTDFVVGGDGGSKISELGKLSHLRNTLSISKLEYVVGATDASEANLKGKNHLNELDLIWTSDVQNERDILDHLQPHEDLKKLTIENYNGTWFPNWIGDPIFSNMVSVRLSKCKNCASLPPLGQLSSLQKLCIDGMEGLERLDSGFYGTGQDGFKPFKSLKTLWLEELPGWMHWMPFSNEGDDFPSLQELKIQGCPQFVGNLPKYLRSLKEMRLHCLDALTTLPDDLLEGNCCLQLLEIVNCPLIPFPGGDCLSILEQLCIANSCDSLESLPLGLFTKLQNIHIEDCRNLKSLSVPEQLRVDLTSLREMKIMDCPNLESFPEAGLPTPNLQSLYITNCNKLTPQKEWGLHKMVALTCFEIEGGCSNVVSFPEEGFLPTTLTSLRISTLPNLELLDIGLQGLTLLETLKINCCVNLKSIPVGGFPTSLSSLHIQDCSLLAQHCQDGGVYWPNISHISCLQID